MNTKCLHYKFETIEQLRDEYLPFFINGAILIPSQDQYELNTEIILEIVLPHDTQSHRFIGKVIWVTPQTDYDIEPSVGIQFCQTAKEVIAKLHSSLTVS